MLGENEPLDSHPNDKPPKQRESQKLIIVNVLKLIEFTRYVFWTMMIFYECKYHRENGWEREQEI